MFVASLAASIAIIGLPLVLPVAGDDKAVTLARTFAKGEKLQYSVASSLHVEARNYGLQTFIPDDLDMNYKFTTEVKEMKTDGVALIHYLRPNMVQVAGATFDTPAKTTVE